MRIILICEGKTEVALKQELKRFIDQHCESKSLPKVKLATRPFDGRTATPELPRRLKRYKCEDDILGVIALTDVYDKYESAEDAKNDLAMKATEADPPSNFFYPHAAQFDVEAWAIPFWEEITKRLRVNARPPGANPEKINRMKPPSKHLAELYKKAKKKYEKPIDLARIIERKIDKAAERCPELRKLLDTLISLCNKQANSES